MELMRDQSSRFSGNSRRATLAAALVVAGLGVGAAGCGDDEDEAVKSVNEALSTAQERADSVRSEADEALEKAQDEAKSVQSEADEA
ncbi:MAG TPA: hypothetical protein VFL56_06905, partial [Solirubrobacterales bacterium]|nr:hypothetical protein [Solirubrobacterales bacterium]